MNLHRIEGKPEWADVPVASRNTWQRWAAATNGFMTPSNVVTSVGLLISIIGLFEILLEHYWLAFVLLAIGRLADIVDGWLAELTKTKSPLGEMIDATADKIIIFLALVTFYATEVAPWWVLTLLLLPQIAISIIVLINRRKKVRLHPLQTGKLGGAAAWVALTGFVLVQALSATTSSLLSRVVTIIAILSVLLSLYATIGYVRRWD